MPTYEYACTSCGKHLEAVQAFKDAPLTTCPACSGTLRKVYSPIGVVFKGSGFYKTDSRGSGSASATKDSGGSDKSAAGGDGSTGAKAGGSESSASSSGADSSPGAASKPKPTDNGSSAKAGATAAAAT